MNSRRYQRESEFRFALFQANQQMQNSASRRGEEGENRRLGLDLEKVLGMVREIVDVTARLTWITAGYGWISIVAPIAIASPAYFTGKLSFGELMVVVGGFNQVNQSLRWFVDNFALLADWRAALSRVIKFREALLRSENGYEQENRAPHLASTASSIVRVLCRDGRSRTGADNDQREAMEEESCDLAFEPETDGIAPIALEGVAEFGLHDQRPSIVELPASRPLRATSRQKSSSPIYVVPSRALREL
jgi:ABC-type multidrug transport system fused ATPase/permease subunit